MVVRLGKSICHGKRKTGLHAGALADTGVGSEPIFILYLRRLRRKQHIFHLFYLKMTTTIYLTVEFNILPILELCGRDEGSTQVTVTHPLGLPPGGILLAHHLKNVPPFKRKSCLLARRGLVLKGCVVKQSSKIDLFVVFTKIFSTIILEL